MRYFIIILFAFSSCSEEISCIEEYDYEETTSILIRIHNQSDKELLNLRIETYYVTNILDPEELFKVEIGMPNLKKNSKTDYVKVDSFNRECYTIKSDLYNRNLIDCYGNIPLSSGYYTIEAGDNGGFVKDY